MNALRLLADLWSGNPPAARFSGAEALEGRDLLSAPFANVDISRFAGNQAEGAIAIDRADPSHVFAVSNIEPGNGLMAATSADGGAHRIQRVIADGSDTLPAACCDPSASFDAFGNLFLGYLNASTDAAVVALSVDQGRTFTTLAQIPARDQPTVTSGPGGVWVTFQQDTLAVGVAGAPDTGLGMVGSFGDTQTIPGSTRGTFGDIAVGPAGQVSVAYQKPARGGSAIYVSVDADGVGPAGFSKPVLVTASAVGGFDHVPQQITRGIDAEASLGYDRSGGPFTGRLYMAYTDEIPHRGGNTDTLLRYSDDNGATWSNPVRLNDDQGLNGQILPRLVVDNSTGQVAVSWYDSRNDLGNGAPGDTDQFPNDDVQVFATVLTPVANGVLVSPNVQISQGTSNADDASSSIDLGDYTGLDFFRGIFEPIWGDNSNSTGDNPNGALKGLNQYTAIVQASAFPQATLTSVGGLTGTGPIAAYIPGSQGVARGRKPYTFTVSYADAAGVDLSTLTGSEILASGPNGFTSSATLVKARLHRGAVLAAYRVAGPSGAWSSADDGTYTLALQPNSVRNVNSVAADGGILGSFVVNA